MGVGEVRKVGMLGQAVGLGFVEYEILLLPDHEVVLCPALPGHIILRGQKDGRINRWKDTGG